MCLELSLARHSRQLGPLPGEGPMTRHFLGFFDQLRAAQSLPASNKTS
jgi:hypothetical protein